VKVEKLSISLERRISESGVASAQREGLSVSAWLARAASAELRRQALADYLAKYQRKHGKFTAAELEQARTDLGYPARARR